MSFVPEVISRQIAKNAFLVQKSSPRILLVAGVAGMVGSTVLACRATLKVETVVDDAREKLLLAKNMEHPEYSEMDRSRDISLIYFQSSVKMVRLYAPSIVIGVLQSLIIF
jgi:hypothetical protein